MVVDVVFRVQLGIDIVQQGRLGQVSFPLYAHRLAHALRLHRHGTPLVHRIFRKLSLIT